MELLRYLEELVIDEESCKEIVEEVIQQMSNLFPDYEEEIKSVDSLEEKYEKLMEFEHGGRTGFDCGFSYLFISYSDAKFVVQEQLPIDNIYISDKRGEKLMLMTTLKYFPARFQSTTIKDFYNAAIAEKLKDKFPEEEFKVELYSVLD